MSICNRCSATPPAPSETGTLCLAPPLAHTQATIRNRLRAASIPFDDPAENVVTIPLEPGRLRTIVEVFAGMLSQAELVDTRSIVLEAGAVLGLADLGRMQPLTTLMARVSDAWLPEVLAEGRLTTHLQPIVVTERPREIFAHECLVRGIERDGSLISPGRLYQTARSAELMFQLDRAARLTAIRTAVSLNLETMLFINFNPTSIYDPAFCLQSTIAAIRESSIRPAQIVFEVVESEEIADPGHLRRIIDFYREAGFRVALDDLGAGFGSLNLLADLKPDFVKLDMQLIRGVDADPYKAAIVSKLLEMAQSLKIASIAEGIETEGEWDWVRRHGADYVQGYLFARPANPPHPPKFFPSIANLAVAE